MGRLVTMLRTRLTREDVAVHRGVQWPDEKLFNGVTFHFSDGRDVRFGREVAAELKRLFDAAADSIGDGKAGVIPLVGGDRAVGE